MGNAASNFTAHGKLAAELPPVKNMGHDDNWSYVDKGMKVFADEKDREQFIHAVLTIATANGTLDLSAADFKLFYSRRPNPNYSPSPYTTTSSASSNSKIPGDETVLIATVAAIREGKIIAKIEPRAGGAEQRDAFLALRRDVESVPSASDEVDGTAGPSMRGGSGEDLPPSYQSSAVGIVGRKEKG